MNSIFEIWPCHRYKQPYKLIINSDVIFTQIRKSANIIAENENLFMLLYLWYNICCPFAITKNSTKTETIFYTIFGVIFLVPKLHQNIGSLFELRARIFGLAWNFHCNISFAHGTVFWLTQKNTPFYSQLWK